MVPGSSCPGVRLSLEVMDAKAALMSGTWASRHRRAVHLHTSPSCQRGPSGKHTEELQELGVRGGRMRPSGEEGPGLAGGRPEGDLGLSYQGSQENLHSLPSTAHGSSGLCLGLSSAPAEGGVFQTKVQIPV